MSSLASAWDALAKEARTEPGWHGRRIRTDAACRIQAASRRPDGVRGVLFEVQAASLPAIAEFPDCAGFLLTSTPLAAGPSGRVRLVLEERSAAFGELFDTLALDVTSRAAAARSEGAAVAALLARLEAWQRFVSRFGAGRLSEEARLGLAAELLFLERTVMPRLPAAEALASWIGPTGAPQDFRFPACLVEIKGSAAASPASFRVSNLEQLSGQADLPLFLCHALLSAGGPDARELPRIVADLRSALLAAGAGGDVLEAMLFEAGYLDTHAPGYGHPVYGLRAFRYFRVAEGFPRLTPDVVPGGVLAATYTVSLAACAPFSAGAGECTALIGNLHD